MQDTIPVPSISVVILSYNQEKFITPALESILEQDYQGEFDVIVADDASTDSSQQRIAEYLKNHPKKDKVTYIARESNVGLAKNIQHAASLSKGDYIVTCGGDDINRVDRISEMVKLINKYPHVKAFSSNHQHIDELGVKATLEDGIGEEIYPYVHRVKLDKITYIEGCTAVWHRDLFTYLGNFDSTSAEDVILSFRNHLLKGDMVKSRKRLVYYRRHSSNICHNLASTDKSARMRFSKFAIHYCPQQLKDICTLYSQPNSNFSYQDADFYMKQIYHDMRRWLLFPHLKADCSIMTKVNWLTSMLACRPKKLLSYINRFISRVLKR